ncbi:MAG: hypothetical protein ACTIIH_11595, partial [Brevibacterium sp.]|uniref:hypothetical protein n=1 Tax=Brevibacterium sp. TaxID=1701 RepID=UPI003F90005E
MGGPTTDDDRRMQLIHRIEYLESELTRARNELAALCETAVSDPTSTRSNAIGQKAQGRPTRACLLYWRSHVRIALIT